MTTLNPQTLLNFALDAVWQAGRLTLGHFQTQVASERKADNTPVTIADRQAEQKLRELIGRYWPDHAILGEEYGQTAGRSAYQWILDPIDGTRSFVCGVPLYANLLALTYEGAPLLGVANFPALGDVVYARRGGGCFWNGRPAQVSKVDKLSDAVLLASDLNTFGPKQPAWERLIQATYIQRTWGDAYGYFLVATGRAEIMGDPIMALWDTAPFQVILEEAGGSFTNWQGEATIYGGEGLATNGRLLPQVMDCVHPI